MLPDSSHLFLFIAAATALIVAPGPAVLYIVARSIDQGRLAGIVSVVGIAAGAQLQVAATAFGMAALLMQSAAAFQAVKLLGAGYLIYLGVKRLLAKDAPSDVGEPARQPLRRVFGEGVVVSLLNPKSALFFVAFLPQFIDPGKGAVALQIFTLGAIFLLIGVASDSVYAMAAGSLRGFLRGRRSFIKAQRYVSGGIYLGLGLATAVSGSRSK